MKKVLAFVLLSAVVSCVKQTAHPPVGGILSQEDLNISKNRSKSLNEMEIKQIQDWIQKQSQSFYPMGLNYWTDVAHLSQRTKKQDGEIISYQYDIYDFDGTKMYEKPVEKQSVVLGKFEELRAVEDAVRYLEQGEEATLLVPSVLGFGTYGDGDKIPNDMPLIIKLKILN